MFEIYSDLDSLGRCGVAYANICKELMPNEERGAIGHIKPSGWHTKDIQPCRFFCGHIDILVFVLPSVWNVAIGTYMTLIGII